MKAFRNKLYSLMFNQRATHKKISETFRRIDELSKRKSLRIVFPNSPLDGKQMEVWKSGNFFEFSLNSASFQISSEYSSLFDTCELFGIDRSYSFEKDSYQSGSIDVQNDKTTGKLTSIIETDSTELTTSYLRLIQPIKDPSKIAHIDGVGVLKPDNSNLTYWGINQITIENTKLDIFRVEYGKNNFIIIESIDRIGFEIFKKNTDAFFAAYAFVFGDSVGEEIYYVSSLMDTFEEISQIIFSKKLDSFRDSYPIFTRKMPLQDGLIYFPKLAFETICNTYLKSVDFARTLKIVFEAVQSELPLTKCVLFAAALETISGLINKNHKKPTPINEDSLKKGGLIGKIEDLVNKDEYLTQDEKTFLIGKKIKYLNSPTNIDKVLEAFKYYKGQLPNSLKKIPAYRNKYFHGSIPEGEQFGFAVDNLIRAFELQFLVGILILKYCGYTGYVQNKAAITEYHAMRKNDPTEKVKTKQSLVYKI